MAYGTDDGFADWLDSLGISLPVSAPDLAVLRARGSDYIDAAFGARFKGVTTAVDQPNQWPRSGVVLNGRPLPDGLVPLAVVQAAYRAALAEGQGFSLSRTIDPTAPIVKREKVDVIETEYFQPPANADAGVPVVAGLDGLLAPFLKPVNARLIGAWVV
ncbi:DnaT-like ssDNA-binding protein [Falsirhodobacter sp. 1013]|uniref:DnaT-like ssDNA-binding protein n=1 Tax=Falsirhodobacter sp. 1013 TaxID=3417566 RepID=UPI003EBFA004